MKIKQLFFAVLFLPSILLTAQSYQLAVDSVAYAPLVKSTSLTNGEIWDDEVYTIPMDFEFEFFGTSFDFLSVDANGLLANDDINGSYDTVSGILAFFVDLADLGLGSGESLSNISYLIQGTVGERVLTIQWANVGFYEDISYDGGQSAVNFQVRIYEQDDTIELHFGDMNVDNNMVFSYYGGGPLIGLLDNLDSDTDLYDELILLEGDPSSPNVVLWEGGLDFQYSQLLMGAPPTNTLYRFTLFDVATQEIQALSKNYVVYPNPSSAMINIMSEDGADEISSVAIYNNDGRLVKDVVSDFNNINVLDLSTGVYHLHIQSDAGLAIKRFVKID